VRSVVPTGSNFVQSLHLFCTTVALAELCHSNKFDSSRCQIVTVDVAQAVQYRPRFGRDRPGEWGDMIGTPWLSRSTCHLRSVRRARGCRHCLFSGSCTNCRQCAVPLRPAAPHVYIWANAACQGMCRRHLDCERLLRSGAIAREVVTKLRGRNHSALHSATVRPTVCTVIVAAASDIRVVCCFLCCVLQVAVTLPLRMESCDQ
jgi:hypothetical protein